MLTVRNVLIASAMLFVVVVASFQFRGAIADAQPAPSLDAGPVTSDIATAPVKPPESVPAATREPHDPGSDASAFFDDVRTEYRRGGLVPAVALAAWGLLLLARRKVKWLQVGWRVAVGTGAIVLLAAVIEAYDRSTSPSLTAVIASIASGLLLWGKTEWVDGGVAK